MLAAFNAVLMRFSGAEDIAMGVPISNRHRPQSQDIVGFLSETLVLRSDLSGDPDFATLLERLREATLEDFRHQDLPLDEIVQIVNPERRRGVTPIVAIGQRFDPNLHQAVAYESSPDHREGEVIDEMRRGYMIGDRLLRPSMVKVAKA